MRYVLDTTLSGVRNFCVCGAVSISAAVVGTAATIAGGVATVGVAVGLGTLAAHNLVRSLQLPAVVTLVVAGGAGLFGMPWAWPLACVSLGVLAYNAACWGIEKAFDLQVEHDVITVVKSRFNRDEQEQPLAA